MRLLVAAVALLGFVPLVGGCASKLDQQGPPDTGGTAARDAADAAFAESAKQPPNAKTMYAMAKILVGQARDRDAVNLLNRIVAQHPDFLPAYNELAGVYFRADRMNDAIAVLGAGLRQAPADPVLLNNLGMCRLSQKEYERAAENFRRAADASPDTGAYRANVAVALGLLGRDEEAMDAYDGVVPPDAADWNLAVLNEARGGGTGGGGHATNRPTTTPGARTGPSEDE